MNLKWLDYITLTLVIIGAVNWGLVGFFKFDLWLTFSAPCPCSQESSMPWWDSLDSMF